MSPQELLPNGSQKALEGDVRGVELRSKEVTRLASAALDELSGKSAGWATMPAKDKVRLLKEMRHVLSKVDHGQWSAASVSAAGIDTGHPANEVWWAAELITNCAAILSQIEGHIETLERAAAGKPEPRLASKVVDGQARLRAWPLTMNEKWFHPKGTGPLTYGRMAPRQALARIAKRAKGRSRER